MRRGKGDIIVVNTEGVSVLPSGMKPPLWALSFDFKWNFDDWITQYYFFRFATNFADFQLWWANWQKESQKLTKLFNILDKIYKTYDRITSDRTPYSLV